jgi:hypothetical protein
MLETPAMIMILIAGADGVIDEKEMGRSEKVKMFRGSMKNSMLREYYKETGKNFKRTVYKLLAKFPDKLSERNYEITKRLKRINKILPELSKRFSMRFYKSLLSYAEQVAKASGGILGFASVSPEEKIWLDLNMIDNLADKNETN